MNADVTTLDITSIAAGGDGVARHEGMVVFVPRTAPGDRVRARLRAKGRFARGALIAVEQPGPGRVAPVCPHYERDRCGGCQLQHLSLDAQRAAKAQMVQDAFARIGKREVPLPAVQGAGEPWRYRRKLTLALRRVGDGWRAGLHRAGAPDEIFALDDCHITDARIVAAFRDVMAQGAHLLPQVPSLRASIRRDDHDVLLVIEGGMQWPEGKAFAAACASVSATWWVNDDGRRRLLLDRRGRKDAGASFVQVNAAVAAALGARVEALVMAHAPSSVIDAYAGTGEVAVALAGRGVQVTAIEFDADASAACAARLAAPSRAVSAKVEDVLADVLPADVVLLNPPRAGVEAAVTATLAAGEPRPRAIIYVSCDPATLARDVSRMPGWRVASLDCYDMFPQTAHVETVCELVPEGV
ncbi:MAG: TRAM domain-containing protein [Gemmatimonadaceae bacterium]